MNAMLHGRREQCAPSDGDRRPAALREQACPRLGDAARADDRRAVPGHLIAANVRVSQAASGDGTSLLRLRSGKCAVNT